MTELAPPNFAERLKRYLDGVQKAGSEAGKAFHFLEFVRDVFKQLDMGYLEKLYPELEKYIKFRSKTLMVRGRPDAFLGNIIIEFKMKLDKESLHEAENELKKYVAILWSRQEKHRVPYITIASDGLNFTVHRPRTTAPTIEEVPPESVILQDIDKLDLHETRPGHAFVWLDRYMLYHTLKPATAEDFSREFGLDMPAYKEAFNLLKGEWRQIRETTLYDQWASFLRLVYGSSVESEDLFIKHTYLATLAKLLAYASFSGGALPVSDDQLIEILEGRIFSEKWGVQNFLEEDFFSWTVKREEGIRVARMILERLATYDLSTVDEDILKALYQELVDPEARHDLGEYYTPDWLAEYMVNRVLKDEPMSGVLDPACGSGTFLAAAIREKREDLKGKFGKAELIEHIRATVQGIDVHPLAVILARTTYLISLGTDLLNARKGPIAVPVYMANSIRLPDEEMEIYNKVEVYKVKADGKILRIPRKVAEDTYLTDRAVEIVKEYARAIASGEKRSEETFRNMLFQKLTSLLRDPQGEALAAVLYETATTISSLISKGRDTIWGFILKNIYKPLYLRKQKFDVLVGNPPWLSYRYIESTDYQDYLRKLVLNQYVLLDSARAELITQMEMATLFFLRCSDFYLKDGKSIAFVMPRSIFVGDQHHNFRSGSFKLGLTISMIIDLEDVKPLFKVPSCVVIAQKARNTPDPIAGLKVKGHLIKKNIRLAEAQKTLNFSNTNFVLFKIGARSFLESEEFRKVLKAVEVGARSYYYENFRQRATIIPRQLWFVDFVKHPKLGLDPRLPHVKTSVRALERAKKEYEEVEVEGQVETKFLYAVATGSELVPFRTLQLPIAVLPVESDSRRYRIIRSDEAGARGFSGLKKWLQKAEATWTEKRGEKAEKLDIYQRLNYSNGITDQSSSATFKVLYNTSGTYLVSCLIKNEAKRIKIDGIHIRLKGVLADHTTYTYDTDDEEEALYLTAMLNSPIIDKLIKPMQSRGLFGERHIHKKVLELPLPKYEKKNELHGKLVELARECTQKVSEVLPELAQEYTSIGKIRQEVKEAIQVELSEIDRIVREILLQRGNIEQNNLENFMR